MNSKNIKNQQVSINFISAVALFALSVSAELEDPNVKRSMLSDGVDSHLNNSKASDVNITLERLFGFHCPNVYDRYYSIPTNKCCQDHAECEAREENYFRIMYTPWVEDFIKTGRKFRSCYCDEEFYSCLSTVLRFKSIANIIGRNYFNIHAPQCISMTNATTCEDYLTYRMVDGSTMTRCTKYKTDDSKPRVQVIDNRVYLILDN